MSKLCSANIDQTPKLPSMNCALDKTTFPRRTQGRRFLRNLVLIWLKQNIDINDQECEYLQTQLSGVIDTVELCTDLDQCIDLCTELEDVKVLMILPDIFVQQLIYRAYDIPQLYCIYVLCREPSLSEELIKAKPKLKGFFRTIHDICELIRRNTRQYDHNSVPVSVISANDCSTQNLNELEPLFMYSRLLKEILFDMDRHLHTKERFVQFLREKYQTNAANLAIINEFEHNYQPASAIWWYTRGCFLFQMLNQALRDMNSDIIIKMGFFLHDLHQQLEKLHACQSITSIPAIVYRGQGMIKSDFDKICRSVGGLLSFNAFTSTSISEQVSYSFCPLPPQDPDTVPVLFEMKIEPTLQSTVFALLNNVSYYSDSENEVLFSMHTVFRIENIEQINDVLWRVKLVLTNDEDPALKRLGERIHEETSGSTGWSSLGKLLIQVGHFNEAQEVYLTLMESLSTDDYEGLASCYHQLGMISNGKADYREALYLYQKAIEFYRRKIPANHIAIASAYSNIGAVYYKTGQCPKALEFYEKTSQIYHDSLSMNDPSLGTLYSNIGTVYESMGKNTQALEFYQKSLNIRRQVLPPNHPSLATIYRNIAVLHEKLGESSKALELYEKALQIQEKTLPPKHPELGITYNNIATLYDTMGNFTEALKYYKKDLNICLEIHPNHHPAIGTVQQNMAVAYDRIGAYAKALDFLQKSLNIRQQSLSDDCAGIAQIYNNMGSVYDHMGDSAKALEYYQKAFDIYKSILPLNHPDLAASLNNIGSMYDGMTDYSKALDYYFRALDIKQISLPPYHPSLTTTYNNIGAVYEKMGGYAEALKFYQKSLDVTNQSSQPNYADLAVLYSNLGHLYHRLKNYSEALRFYEKSLEIDRKISISDDTIELATVYNNIGSVYTDMDAYPKALEYHQKSMNIKQRLLPVNHPSLATTYNNIGLAYEGMQEYPKALEFYEKDLAISRAILPANHLDLATTLSNMGSLYFEAEEYQKALPFYEEALAIAETSLSADHPDLQQHIENLENLRHCLQRI